MFLDRKTVFDHIESVSGASDCKFIELIETLNDTPSQGVDIQLRILQTLVSPVPNLPPIHGGLLADVSCFFPCESS